LVVTPKESLQPAGGNCSMLAVPDGRSFAGNSTQKNCCKDRLFRTTYLWPIATPTGWQARKTSQRLQSVESNSNPNEVLMTSPAEVVAPRLSDPNRWVEDYGDKRLELCCLVVSAIECKAVWL